MSIHADRWQLTSGTVKVSVRPRLTDDESRPPAVSVFGAGHLAAALLAGLASAGAPRVRLHDRSAARAHALREHYPGLDVVSTPEELPVPGGVLLLLVPPEVVLAPSPAFVDRARRVGAFVVSCAAGVGMRALSGAYPGVRVARALPNLNWGVRRGVTLVQYGPLAVASDHAVLAHTLGGVSVLHEVDDEGAFDRVGTLTACGPGLLAELLDQVAAAFGVVTGAERALWVETLLGTATYLAVTGKAPEEVVGEVANPGGLTGVGVTALREMLPAPLGVVRARMSAKIADRNRAFGDARRADSAAS